MIKFLFEDNYDTPSSVLLRHSYNGDNILFAGGGGSSNMFKAIEECKNASKDITIIAFFDLPPNNEKAYRNYEALLERLLESDYTDVYIVPIVCIEYYILKFLIKNKYLMIDNKYVELVASLITSFDYNNKMVKEFVNINNYRKSSLEHVYKELLTFLALKSKCMLNYTPHDNKGHIIDDSFHGVFYKRDCTCDRKFCKSDCHVSLKEKAERLYAELPIFDVIDNEHRNFINSLDITVKGKSFKRLFDEIELFFDKICKSMSIQKPLVVRYD